MSSILVCSNYCRLVNKFESNNEDDFESNTAVAAVVPYPTGDSRIQFCISNNKVFSNDALVVGVVGVASNKVFIEN
ncbi:MAG: hypothetical protein ACI8RD_007194 [Bacillariaceae sp.]